jgi:hypothetical protein
MVMLVLAAPAPFAPAVALVLLGGYSLHAKHRTDWGWAVRRWTLAILVLALSLLAWRVDPLGVRAWFNS